MYYLKLLVVLTWFLTVNTVSIQGSEIQNQTFIRYNPCDLNVIYFDKINEKLWKGLINLELYMNVTDVEIEISFKNPVDIFGSYKNITTIVQNDGRDYNIIICGENGIPKNLSIYVTIKKNVTSTEDIPLLNYFTINDNLLCGPNNNSSIIHNLDILDDLHNDSYVHKCGRKSYNHSEITKINTEANMGDWPWIAALLLKDRYDKFVYIHSGVIVSRTAVISTGFNTNIIMAVAGVNNYEDDTQIGRQALMVDKVLFHPNYNRNEATSHLAICKVNKWRFTEYVQPICIWGPKYDKSSIGKHVTMVGFVNRDSKDKPKGLRSTFVQVDDRIPCPGYSEKDTNEYTICSSFGETYDKLSYEVDFISSIIIPISTPDRKVSWYLRGVLTAMCFTKSQACYSAKNGIFTDIAPHYPWILHHSQD